MKKVDFILGFVIFRVDCLDLYGLREGRYVCWDSYFCRLYLVFEFLVLEVLFKLEF